VRGTPYGGFAFVLYSFFHREPVLCTVLADLLSRKVHHIVPGALLGSISEPPDLEKESLLVIVPLLDTAVEDSLNRLTGR